MTLLTPTERLQRRLAQLLGLLEPHRDAWRDYVVGQAALDAKADEEFADLPRLVRLALRERGIK